MPAPAQEPLYPDLREARFTFAQMEAAYQDGIEDLGQKITEAIYNSGYEITHDEIIQLIEDELGWGSAEPPPALPPLVDVEEAMSARVR